MTTSNPLPNNAGSAIRDTLYWNPEPLFGQLGGRGTWTNDPTYESWSDDDLHTDDNVKFSNGDNVIFAMTDGNGNSTRSENTVNVLGNPVSGNISTGRETLVQAHSNSLNPSLTIASGAEVSGSGLTLDGILGGNTSFTVLGGITFTGVTPFTGRMTLDGGGVNVAGQMSGGPTFALINNGDLSIDPGGSVTGGLVTMDRIGGSRFSDSVLSIVGEEGNEASFSGRVRMEGDRTDIDLEDYATFTGALTGTAIRGGVGGQDVDLDGADTRLSGNVKLGDDADSFQVYAGFANGRVDMGAGRDYLSLDGSGNDIGTLMGSVKMGTGIDDLVIYEDGSLIGNVDMGDDADDVDLRGTLSGSLRLGDGDDELEMDDSGALLTGRLSAKGGADDIDIVEGTVQDVISLGDGNDSLTVGVDAILQDRVLGGTGNDSIQGSSGNDTLLGGAGNDTLDGSVGDDRLLGNNDNDSLIGGEGDDTLYGGSGDDTLAGGDGGDVLIGNSGADRFVFNVTPLPVVQGAPDGEPFPGPEFELTRDKVRDFRSSAGDKIDLSGIDADVSTNDDDAFVLIAGDLTGTAGEVSARSNTSGTLIRGDITGDGRADFAIMLNGVASVTESDFIL